MVTSICNFSGSCIVGFIYSWNILLVGFAPLLLLAPAGYGELKYMAKFEEESGASINVATSYATENVNAVKVCGPLSLCSLKLL